MPHVLYVDALIGRDTINTIPPEDVYAFRDHGTIAAQIYEQVSMARVTLGRRRNADLDLPGATAALAADAPRHSRRQ